jgi:hypothetical protein
MNQEKFVEKIHYIITKYPKDSLDKYLSNIENIRKFFPRLNDKSKDREILNRFIVNAKKKVVETSGLTETEASSTAAQIYKYFISVVDITVRTTILYPLCWFFILLVVLKYKVTYPHRKITKNTILEAAKLYIYKTNILWAKNKSKGKLEKKMSIAVVGFIFFSLCAKAIAQFARMPVNQQKDLGVMGIYFMSQYIAILLDLSVEYLRQTSED